MPVLLWCVHVYRTYALSDGYLDAVMCQVFVEDMLRIC
jgi:hypothetical protein